MVGYTDYTVSAHRDSKARIFEKSRIGEPTRRLAVVERNSCMVVFVLQVTISNTGTLGPPLLNSINYLPSALDLSKNKNIQIYTQRMNFKIFQNSNSDFKFKKICQIWRGVLANFLCLDTYLGIMEVFGWSACMWLVAIHSWYVQEVCYC